MERVGVITDEISVDVVEALTWLQEQGLRYAEIRMVDGVNVAELSDGQADRIREEAKARGIRISAVASPVFKCALNPARPVADGDRFGQQEEGLEAHFAKLERLMAIAKRLGTGYIRIFSFWREQEPSLFAEEIAAHLARAAKLAERENLVLLLENEPVTNGGYAQEVVEFVKRIGSPSLCALWDPGNEMLFRRGPHPQALESIRPYIAHVHLKDAAEDDNGEWRYVPIGQGRTPFAEQMVQLEEDGYRGLYVLETHYVPPGGTNQDGTRQSLDGLLRILREVESRLKPALADQTSQTQPTAPSYTQLASPSQTLPAPPSQTQPASPPQSQLAPTSEPQAPAAAKAKTWGFAIVGTGMIAEFHAKAIAGLTNGRLAGIAGSSEEKARSFADQIGADCMAVGDYSRLLASPEIDIVCVATPSGSHFAIGVDVLRAGKHLILEKPMAMTVEEADELIALAEGNSMRLAVISQRRFEPPYQLAKRMLDEGRLGRLLFIEAQTPFYRSQAYYDSAAWRGTVAQDGGALMNQAIHQIDLMLWFAGPCTSIFGKTATQTHDMEAEDIGIALATFASGAYGVVTGSTSLLPGFPPAVKLYGEHGTIWIEGNRIAHWTVPGIEAPSGTDEASPEGGSDPKAISPVNHRTQMADMTEAIACGRPPLVGGKEGREALRFIQAVYDSSRTGQEVRLMSEV